VDFLNFPGKATTQGSFGILNCKNAHAPPPPYTSILYNYYTKYTVYTHVAAKNKLFARPSHLSFKKNNFA